jgi:hypothetical protein
MLLGRHTCARDLTTLDRKLVYHSILTYALSDSITLGRNLMCYSILTYALRQTYLYK